MIKRILTLFLLGLSLNNMAQQISPSATFQKDSIAIGEEVPYSLWIRYPRDMDVIFPDSLYDFTPFEINSREYFTTRSDSTQSLDSVVYYLSTFEIDSVQYIQLPIYLLEEFDSVELRPGLDSIVLHHVVEALPDSVTVIVNTDYQKVPLAFNYPYFTAGIIILLIAALIVFLAFGGRIRKMIRVFWVSRRHKRFIKTFTEYIQSDDIEVEKSIAFWKRYLEKLEQTPYSKLTTKEIFENTEDISLKENLAVIDRYIYATAEKPDTSDSFEFLLNFAEDRYHQKIDQIKNG